MLPICNSFPLIMSHIWNSLLFSFIQAYKAGYYGPQYVWIIYGHYDPDWWLVNDQDDDEANWIGCTSAQMKKAVEGYIGVKFETLSKLPNKTVSGYVSINSKCKIHIIIIMVYLYYLVEITLLNPHLNRWPFCKPPTLRATSLVNRFHSQVQSVLKYKFVIV